jgi:micrococcal nuclease
MSSAFVAGTLVALAFAKPIACAAPASRLGQESSCIVARVVDGDTFYCRDGRKIRLTGIDSPERQQEPFGAAARQALLTLLPPGSVVRLERDVANTDQYGRVLAYTWVDSTLINEAMVRGGWAVLYTVPPNVKYAARLAGAQNEARAHRTGLWIGHGFDCQPKEFRRGKCVS